MKRGAAIEPSVGYLKAGKRMGRNRLEGVLGDQLNAVLAAARRPELREAPPRPC